MERVASTRTLGTLATETPTNRMHKIHLNEPFASIQPVDDETLEMASVPLDAAKYKHGREPSRHSDE